MKRTVSVLGSTGSIGVQSLEVIQNLNYNVAALTGNRNSKLLEEQARKYRPKLVAAFDEGAARDLKIRLKDTGIPVLAGMEGLIQAAVIPEADTVVTSVVGMVGLRPTLAAIREKKRIALSNKETLVCAGSLVMEAARESGAEILPVDSEHSAIFQCLRGDPHEVKKLILTASGGPFRNMDARQLGHVKKEDALRHPNWSMGAKITVDSATMMNKGLEYIEAMHLFHMPPENIEILVHPQSIVHSMVAYADHSVIAQMGVADMKLPIQLALTWPRRLPAPTRELDLAELGSLTFEKPNPEVFTCLKLALDVARAGGTAPTVMNAADEEAVDLFLRDKIRFCEISDCIAKTVDAFPNRPGPGLEEILAIDAEARAWLRSGKVAK